MVKPAELWMISRGADGYAGVARAADDERLMAMVAAGGQRGWLWIEGHLRAADPGGVTHRMDVEENRSKSFCELRDGSRRLVNWKEKTS